MSSAPDPAPEPNPAPKPPSALWRWIKRIGCALLLITLSCCGLTCTAGWLGGRALRNLNGDELDRFHAEGMQGGDIKKMHDRADPEFRKRHDFDALRAFLDARPGILDRDNLFGMTLERRKIGADLFIKVRSQRGWLAFDQWEIVCKVVDGVMVFVGISPGLDEVVPSSFRFRSGGRRHRFD